MVRARYVQINGELVPVPLHSGADAGRAESLLRPLQDPEVLAKYATRLAAAPLPPLLYHYTSATGLEGILRSGIFWASDAFNLNDDTEVRFGVESACDFLIQAASNPSASETVKLFAQTVSAKLRENIESAANFFVCSFTALGDDSGQWKKYADGGKGYALALDTAQLERDFTSVAPQHHTFPISYDARQMQQIQRSLVDEALRAVRSAGVAVSPDFLRRVSVMLSVNVIQCAAQFKSPGWASECEYRFLMVKARDALLDERRRRRGDDEVRYCEYDWKSRCAAALQQIVVGPNADPSFAEGLCRQHFPESGVLINRSNCAGQ